ncbi:hypothetical protein C0Q70_05923 [Pomacea canaliculata]|uniref:Alpha-2-macroglobulin bait region domain-containing protein n=1 Tax=Pomacea canaliculata TaxID=400727 RepID=A0A2T7PMI9_POMCA|nr:hypothetical protein C0Q70_05923 [Pomacea canaliculata]
MVWRKRHLLGDITIAHAPWLVSPSQRAAIGCRRYVNGVRDIAQFNGRAGLFISGTPGGDRRKPPTVINLMIPRDLKIPDENDFYYWSYSRQFEIRVVATGDVAFNRSGDMTLEDKSFSIFVQTDKAMYKPGDTIRWRILAMKPDLTVLNELVDVFIKDPLNNVIRQWKGVSGGDSGVVELSMPTSDRLVLGDWTIEAKVLGVKQTKTFTVAEYVLPKYEAKVDVPANVLSTDPVKGTASAKHTRTGQPGQLLSLDYDNVQIIVNTTDPATGRQMGADADVQFSKFLAKVEFLPVSASNFKPGLLYTAYLQVTRYDGTNFANPESITVDFQVTVTRPNNTATTTASPTTTTTTQSTTSETNANETLIEVPIGRPGFWGPIYWEPEYSEQYKVTKTLTANGFLSLDVTLPEDAKRVDIEATVMNATAYSSASRSNSPSDNFLQLLLTSRNPKVGEVVEFTARTTEPVKHITYQVNVTFSVETAKPGDTVNLVISAKPNTTIFLLSVDKSVQLLKSGNDITQDTITEELVSYDYGSGFYGYWRYMFICGWPYPSRGSDASQVFNVFSPISRIQRDSMVFHKKKKILTNVTDPVFRFASNVRGGMAEAADFASPPASPDSPVERIRKNFPETWLWSMVIVGSSGIYIQPEIAPDTITTWLTTAIAVHPLYGLSVTPKPAEMTLTMGKTDGIQVIRLQRNNRKPKGVEEVRQSISVSHYLGTVSGCEAVDTDFCFTPVKLGSLPIRVNLTTPSVPGDGVEQMLLVKPEGTPKSEAESIILDVRPGVLFSHIANITFPSGVVQGSQHISVAIAGMYQ